MCPHLFDVIAIHTVIFGMIYLKVGDVKIFSAKTV